MGALVFLVLLWALPGSAWAQEHSPAAPEDEARYDIRDDVLIRTHDGAVLSATVVSPRGVTFQNNGHSYPDPIIEDRLAQATELEFVSEPFDAPTVVSGAFTGELDVTINRKDFDAGVTVFEQLPDGRLFHLAYWLGRASFASDATVRRLLTPGRAARIPFETTTTSRRLSKGSRLLVLLDVNKNAIAEVNYGTGKDVADESITDADGPLEVDWHTDSFVSVPFDP